MRRSALKRTLEFRDPREMPAYGIREAARYLQIPDTTLKSWVLGRHYETMRGRRFFQPVIELPEPKNSRLSFFNLVEAHVLSAFRREYGIELRHIRAAVRYVSRQFGWKHPLIEQKFETDGVRLFVEKLGTLVDATAQGQIVMEAIRPYFQRIERVNNVVARLYLFTRNSVADHPKAVFIDPRFSFGKPCLTKSHIPTAIIAERYKAGESVAELAKDYGCDRLEIEEGLRCELDLQIAA